MTQAWQSRAMVARASFPLRVLVLVVAFLMPACVSAQSTATNSGRDTFIQDLMRRMTLEEKVGQLNLLSLGFDITGPQLSTNAEAKIRQGVVGGVFNVFTPVAVRKLQALALEESRLRIPLLFGFDVIHGHKTIFPMPLGLSCSWDMDAIERSARIAAIEASADGLNWTFSPMVDIARDPRWGRIVEGAGEDPFLGSAVARAMVRGYQGNNLADHQAVLACVKHFALYGAGEGGRDYNTVDMSRLQMLEFFLPPYRAAVEAGVGSIMSAFNEIDGLPASGNRWLMTDLLRSQWGFDGFVVSDYTAINEMTEHGTGDARQNAELALRAGIDMDMVGETFLTYVSAMVAEGRISETLVDQACRRILEAKFKLGLFKDPFRGCTEERALRDILTAGHRNAAREIAAKSFVLLRNTNNVLPLAKSGTIALIGPLVDDQYNLLGSWRAAGDSRQAVSVRAGFSNVAPSATVLYARGANLVDDPELLKTLRAFGTEVATDDRSPEVMLSEAVSAAARADVVVAVLGESAGMSGEAASRSDIGLPEGQRTLLRALAETGKPLVLVLMNGRPLTLVWESEVCDAVLETWFAGSEGGNAIADVLFGNHNPSGKLTATFPRHVGQIPLYYNRKNTGRPYKGDPAVKFVSRYLDVPNDPLYPFGHGLSYTAFSYSEVKLSSVQISDNDVLRASVLLTNTGKFAGEETVQLYVTDPIASVTRSILNLRDFKKVQLRPGESAEVEFRITPETLKFYNSDLKYDWEPGDFVIRIGGSSAEWKSATVRWDRSNTSMQQPR